MEVIIHNLQGKEERRRSWSSRPRRRNENLSLNNDANNQQFLQIAIRNDNDDSDLPLHQHVSKDISEDSEELPIKKNTLV